MPFPDVASMNVLVEQDPAVQLGGQRGDTLPASACKWYGVVGPAVQEAFATAVRVPSNSVFTEAQEVLCCCEGAKVRLIGVDLS